MNRLYTSSRNERLCEKLAENVKGQTGSLFQKTMIITQSGGMNSWLTTQLAMENGIFAHYEFANPDGFMGKVYELLFGEKFPSGNDTIRYTLYNLLGSEEFIQDFPSVAEYYHDHDLRRMQLATKVADLFDQYQLYRDDFLQSWENDTTQSDNDAEPWQKWLWRALQMESRVKIKVRMLEKLNTHSHLLRETWPEIHLFGIAIYTEYHRDFYEKIGQYINVHFYVCLPTQDPVFKNDLLESYGKKAGELITQFSAMQSFTEEFPQNNPATLLGRLQQSIRQNTDLENKTHDDSIQVHSCHTPVREVEALYNYLVGLFEADRQGARELKAGDILVITPDINKYGPYVKAVFRNAPVKLPFQVSGAARNTDDSITAALEMIMQLREDEFTAPNVVGILEHNRIRKTYQVQDCSYIRWVVDKVNIRFGRENSIEDDTHYVSWKYGLEKIILGYAMHTDEQFEDKYPFKDAEASASYDLLRMKAFVDDLLNLFDRQKELLTLKEWRAFFLAEVVERMVHCNNFKKDDRLELKSVYMALAHLENQETEKVSYDIFLSELNMRLFSEISEHRFGTGRITVTSAIPARGIPHKVIAFIGLDNGAFPRKDHFMGFDLLGEDIRMGDRSKAEADKFLFLDTLMAAREKLYLSYVGQSAKDNTDIPPSIVLDTLVDYLQLDKEIVKHPLHGFSSKYDGENLVTWLYSEKPHTFSTKEVVDSSGEKLQEIWVNSFVKFFEAPIDWYFKHVLGIRYEEDDDTLEETELFGLDYLQQWSFKQELLKHEGDPEALLHKGIKQGVLPLKNQGKYTAEQLMDELQPLKQKYHDLTD